MAADVLADPVWRECFGLAWESFRAGGVAVGAVLVDPSRTVVARGRNRLADAGAPRGQLAGSHLAHAELNALATLPPGDYPGHTLYTTLEPCLLCTAALRYSHVGTVVYAGEDPLCAGIDRIPTLSPELAHRFTTRIGPAPEPLRTLALVLHVLAGTSRGSRVVVDPRAGRYTWLLPLARSLDADALRRMTPTDGMATILARLSDGLNAR
jgi:tRNA(adenine34) deaminase